MVAKEVPMPLRDHFRPPVNNRVSWEEIHGMWPARIVLQLRTLLPTGYVAGPKIHAGSQVEIDVATFEHDEVPRLSSSEYEVRIYDAERGRQLVAAIELVSPGNKDRPEKRNAFVGKCAALLQKGVAVSIVDLVTPRQFNLYAELLQFLGQTDPTLGEPLPYLYAVSCRWRPRDKRMLLQTWSHTLALGKPLPTLPLWLTEKLAVPLDLEQSYEQACHDLWLT
jgi:hypothetical protein